MSDRLVPRWTTPTQLPDRAAWATTRAALCPIVERMIAALRLRIADDPHLIYESAIDRLAEWRGRLDPTTPVPPAPILKAKEVGHETLVGIDGRDEHGNTIDCASPASFPIIYNGASHDY
jgi:hypothetical protein